jgi:hypothetical protein
MAVVFSEVFKNLNDCYLHDWKLFFDEGHKCFVALSKGQISFMSRMGNFNLSLKSLRF